MTRSSSASRLLLGNEHPCSYLPGRSARSLFIDPAAALDDDLYGRLLGVGFRRSGRYVYRPACRQCTACRAARIPVGQFAPGRSQRRCLARNADLHTRVTTRADESHYQLYQRYLSARHPDGGMDPGDRDTFDAFLAAPWGRSAILEVRDASDRLLAGAVTDRLPQGLSAVYTWFEPDAAARGLGTFCILQQVAWARSLALPHLYLGYWVSGSRTMDYKRHFRPLEVMTDTGWERTI